MSVTIPSLSIVQALAERIQAGERHLDIVGPWGSGKTALALQTAHALGRSLLIVTAGRSDAEGVFEDLTTLTDERACALLPAWEVSPSDIMEPSDDIVAERMDTLRRLSSAGARGDHVYAVTPVRAFLQRVVRADDLLGETFSLSVGEEHDLEAIVAKLVGMGYRRELMVEQRGEMSVRGGIFDVFPISSDLPYRIEFFGDEIESIRRFEPETQRSVEHVDSVQILPRSEKALLSEHVASGSLVTLADYLTQDTLVVFDEPMAVQEEAHSIEREAGDSPYAASWPEVLEKLGNRTKLSLAQIDHDPLPGAARVAFPMGSISGWSGDLKSFWEQMKQWDQDNFKVILICNNIGERKRLLELLAEQGYEPGGSAFDLRVEIGRLHAGFSVADDRLAVLSEREIFGRHYVRRVRRRFEAGAGITDFSDLRAGDFVVHAVHGIGRYEGLRRFPGMGGDFLVLRYAGGDALYVPVTQVDRIQKYFAGEDASPKVDKLGGATWAKTKSRVKKAVRDMTEELVKLYAARESERGHAFSPDTPWQHEFEDAFEYDETPDQARAIDDTKADMESARPMDRLICGDVGYGKTEVALRAAFKAVMDANQVAVLVPTTILAQQHYSTFSERLADYPVRVGVLSRFRSAKEQQLTIDAVKAGEVDIVVGTHRLLSKDIQFKKLGLVIIDEEQKFGVAHKERLKQLRTHVDVLTLTATPIPRTLHFSLMGIRDLSVINTAPNDRLPIHTCIEAFDEEVIQEALQRELARDGQVFFLHNRVQTIQAVANMVKKLVPKARVGIGHGQMAERELEKVMASFVRHELDVLVCTTIIGSGVDIPNVNTIIVDRADRFGLAELYQIRGRVGRYKHRAFAYLLIPGDRVPTEDAQKRLKALEEFSTLGSGYRIAMRDLEIRGCGNILGAEQHGHIAAVGYETYSRMIKDAVAEMRGQPVYHRDMPPFEIAIDAYIPDDYVSSESQKMTLYKRIAGISSVEAAKEMTNELTDRFGRPPMPVQRLIDIMRVRAMAAEVGAKSLSAGKDNVSIQFESAQLLTKKARSLLKETFGTALDFTYDGAPTVKLALGANPEPLRALERLVKVLTEQ